MKYLRDWERTIKLLISTSSKINKIDPTSQIGIFLEADVSAWSFFFQNRHLRERKEWNLLEWIFFLGLVLSDIYEAAAKIKAAIILVRLFFSKGFLFDEDD